MAARAACGARHLSRFRIKGQPAGLDLAIDLRLDRLLKFAPTIQGDLISSEAGNLLLNEINQLPTAGSSLCPE